MTHRPILGVPTIARHTWREHPNFKTQALLLRSHRSFRRVSEWLLERAESGETAQLRMPFRHWKGAMHGHEHYEESKLYPFLERRFGVDLSELQAGHEELQRCEELVYAAFTEGTGLTEALREHHNALLPHLEFEEDVVIPCVLSLTAEEFEDYSNFG